MDWFPAWSFYAVPWLAAAWTGVALLALRRPWWKAVGGAMMAVPVWDTLWGILSSLEPLVAGGLVLRPYTHYELSYVYSYKFLDDLGWLGAGFLVHECGGRWDGLFLGPRRWAQRLAALGVPTGGRTEAHSAFLGAVAVPLLVLGSIAIDYFTRGAEGLRQSDESSVFANMTLYHAILLSAAAALGEELVYRGLLMTALARRMPMLAAVAIQAVVFGFAHSGYGTWIHVLLPTLFGVVVGVAAWRFGIWMAIAMHFLVDLYAFTAEATANQAWLLPLLNSLFLANCALTVGWGAWWAWGRLARSPNPPSWSARRP